MDKSVSFLLSGLVSLTSVWRLQPDAAAAPRPGPVCQSWPGRGPAERFWVAAMQPGGPSATLPGRERPGQTGCPQLAASPAGWRCGRDVRREPAGSLLLLKAPQTAREESQRGSLLEEVKDEGQTPAC